MTQFPTRPGGPLKQRPTRIGGQDFDPLEFDIKHYSVSLSDLVRMTNDPNVRAYQYGAFRRINGVLHIDLILVTSKSEY
jgi:hypothetical protein